jgi:DNA-binding HxlR family transcriptional regulator
LGKVNPQTLSGRLKVLEHCGIVTRTAYAEIPPRVEYDLTEKGRGVSEIVKALAAFGQKYRAEIEAEMGITPCSEAAECPPKDS